ncbi:MAG TPA: DUF4350 domain-containing protein [Egibacteraceae bacterium]|nr:DUF4350 domain-containing protein [Egibacteraceae bacterium]
MTGPPDREAPGRGFGAQARRWAPLAALFAFIVAAAVIGGPPQEHGPPLDPRSSDPLGTKALADLLGELGAEVRVEAEPQEGAGGTALLLFDDLDEDRAERLEAWVRAGGTLVLADPHSPLAPRIRGSADIGGLSGSIAKRCDLAALEGVERVAAPGSTVLEAPAGGVGCFPRGEGHWLVVTEQQDGAVVALGGWESLVNANLGEADNAVLAAALLAPRPGGIVTFLRPPLPGEGQATLGDLVAPRVRLSMLQMAAAFVLAAAWRARRLGLPVIEGQPVQIPGSELVVAVGNLLQQTKARTRAARLLREDARTAMAERLGLPPGAPPERVADAVAQRTGAPAARVQALLSDHEPADDAALVRLAQEAERIRRQALAVSGAPPIAGPADGGAPARSNDEGAARVH